MPSTYTLISSNVLASSAASVTFSAIPSTYTDLVLRMSMRGSASADSRDVQITLNAATTNYSFTALEGAGSAGAFTSRGTTETYLFAGYSSAALNTANTFASSEIYIPSYTASQNKPISSFTVKEDNTTTGAIEAVANLWRNTAAITSIAIQLSTGNFVSGSSFYLYGIKNS
jgi:hypothetical protein